MNTKPVKLSEQPVHVRFGEYLELKETGRIVTIGGLYYLPVEHQMHPVRIAWQRH